MVGQNPRLKRSLSKPSIVTLQQKARARWAGHVVRKPDSRLPKHVLQRVLPGQTNGGGTEEKLHRLPENLPHRPQHRHQLLGDTCPGPHKLAQQARNWCSCSRAWYITEVQRKYALRFNYHYPLVPYVRATLQSLDWTCQSSTDPQSPFINLEWSRGHLWLQRTNNKNYSYGMGFITNTILVLNLKVTLNWILFMSLSCSAMSRPKKSLLRF